MSNIIQMYNLLASLLQWLLAKLDTNPTLMEHLQSLTAEDDDLCRLNAENLLLTNGIDDRLLFLYNENSTQICENIVNECSRYDDFHVTRWVVILLDHYISWETFADYQDTFPFSSLNSNTEETGLILLPRVPTIVPTHGLVPIKAADRFYPRLNEILSNCYCISQEKLWVNGIRYQIKNIIYQPKTTPISGSNIKIAYSPLAGCETEKILQINYDSTWIDGHKYDRFTVDGVHPTQIEDIQNRYLQFVKTACEIGADIACSCEMLCTDDLFALDSAGFNPLLSDLVSGYSSPPSLILAPTHSRDGKNSLRVYSHIGKCLLTQDKQFSFIYTKDNKKYTENLSNREPVIWILHIPNWGRLTFPICKDYLVPEYRDLLIRELKTSLIICPSYSFGSRDFELDLSGGRPYGTVCFWGNSCLSLEANWCKYVGAVQHITIGKSGNTERFQANCEGKCRQNCIFSINLPLNYASLDWHNDICCCIEHLDMT